MVTCGIHLLRVRDRELCVIRWIGWEQVWIDWADAAQRETEVSSNWKSPPSIRRRPSADCDWPERVWSEWQIPAGSIPPAAAECRADRDAPGPEAVWPAPERRRWDIWGLRRWRAAHRSSTLTSRWSSGASDRPKRTVAATIFQKKFNDSMIQLFNFNINTIIQSIQSS